MKWFSVFIFVLGIVIFAVPTNHAYALAGVGTEQICVVNDVSASSINSMDSDDADGQTFIAPATFNLGAIKLNSYITTALDGASLTVRITDVLGASPGGAPDLNNVLGTEVYDTTLVPIFDQVTASNNLFNCDPDIRSGQVIIFDPAIPLSSGTQYAITIEGVGGSVLDDFLWPYTGFDDFYPDGNHFECNVPTACTKLTPATWDLSGGIHDAGFAVFDDIIQFENPADSAEAWLERLLSDLGLNDVNGKLLVTVMVAFFLTIALVMAHTHPIIILGILSMWAGAAITATLIPPWITFTMAAIFMMMLLWGLILSGRSGSD